MIYDYWKFSDDDDDGGIAFINTARYYTAAAPLLFLKLNNKGPEKEGI